MATRLTGTYSIAPGYTHCSGSETVAQAFDNNSGTKICIINYSSGFWMQVDTGGFYQLSSTYTIYSANDAPERDPRNWTIQGSNNGSSWTTLDTVTNQGSWGSRQSALNFTLDSSAGPFRYYRMNVTSVQSGTIFQISELQLFGTLVREIAPSDTVTLSETTIVSIQAPANLFLSASDTINLSESLGFSNPINQTAQDLITLSENISLSIDLSISVSDSISIGENQSGYLELNPFATDSITITESTTLSIPIKLAVSDSITISDNFVAQVPIGFSVQDAITTTDIFGRSLEAFISGSDNLTLTENTSLDIPITPRTSDIITISESVANLLSNSKISTQDTITLLESLGLDIPNEISKSELISLSESLNLTVPILTSHEDVITVTDLAQVVMPDPLAINKSEQITLSESFSADVVTFLKIHVSDSITVTDILQDIGFADFLEIARTLILVDGRLAYRITGKYSGVPYYIFV